MKQLTLDYSKWRCGGSGKKILGKGPTNLFNDDGYMCCLGQFSLQIEKKLTPSDIQNLHLPSCILKKGKYNLNPLVDNECNNSTLSHRAVTINDFEDTTPEEKIKKLRSLFKEYSLKIRVINKPK